MEFYPQTIKKIKRGNVYLEHYITLDEMGFERDFFQLVRLNQNKSTSILPFRPKIVANNYSRNEPIKFTNNYSNEDYEEMFNENCLKFNGRQNN